jgi:hypothetical protein
MYETNLLPGTCEVTNTLRLARPTSYVCRVRVPYSNACRVDGVGGIISLPGSQPEIMMWVRLAFVLQHIPILNPLTVESRLVRWIYSAP